MDEWMKQNKLNFKSDNSTKVRIQKRGANDKSGGGNWKSKFRKAIEIDQSLKQVMSMIASEE